MLSVVLRESVLQMMRATIGWAEHHSDSSWGVEDYLFQFGDAKMTIFPDGSWECQIRGLGPLHVYLGNVSALERFLRDSPGKMVKAKAASA